MFAILRSTTSKQVQLITPPWRLRELPPTSSSADRGRLSEASEARLRLHYRRALAREGYCVVDVKAPLYGRDDLANAVMMPRFHPHSGTSATPPNRMYRRTIARLVVSEALVRRFTSTEPLPSIVPMLSATKGLGGEVH